MENDGPHNLGEEHVDATTNVVQFPRDWFGPREELVPLGEPPAPVRADDFWGEGSASIHDAMQAPEGDCPAVGVARAPASRLPALALPGFLSIRPPRRLIVGGLGAVCVLAVALVGSMWPAPVRLPQTGRSDAALSPAVIGAGVPAIVPRRGHSGTARHRGSGRRGAARHAVVSHARARARSSGGGGGGGGAAPATSQGTGTPSTSSGAAAPASSGSTSDSTNAASTQPSSGSGAGASQSSGPVGPGAPFGPGHLG